MGRVESRGNREQTSRGLRGSLPTKDRDMLRDGVCRPLGVLLLGAGPLTAFAADEPPPLSPPSLAPPASIAEPDDLPTTAWPGSGRAIENRPMLVIPGVNAPARVHSRDVPLPTLEPAGPAGPGEAPLLVGPSG